MHVFFALMERGAILVRSAELTGGLEPEDLAALRAEGIVRPHSLPGTRRHEANEEISIPDFVRALRRVYEIDPRGLPTPGGIDPRPMTIGWTGRGTEEREVVLVHRSGSALSSVLHRNRRTLALVYAGRWLKDDDRKHHGPDAFVSVDALDEVLVVRDGRLAYKGRDAPVEPTPPPSAAPARATARPSTRAHLPIPGATRWNLVSVYLVNQRTVRIDCGGRSHRRSYLDLGMAHAASREPTRVWDLLVAFCEGNGYLQTSRFGNSDATKMLVHRLRKALKDVFGLEGDPFFKYSRKQSWKTRFLASGELPKESWEESEG
jgi:hypothetical protein